MRNPLAAVVLCGLSLLGPAELRAQKRSPDRLTREEILASARNDLDLYEVIRLLRPRFLEGPRGTRSAFGATRTAALAVFVDGRRDAGVETLRTIRSLTVQEVQYLDPTHAENEYGPTASGGALLIKLV